jgi:para-aminobenzoate synthetase component 1
MKDEPLLEQLPWTGDTLSAAASMQGRPYPFFLDSVGGAPRLGRFSFLGCEPYMVLRSRGRTAELIEMGSRRTITGHPLDILQELLDRNAVVSDAYPVPFVGGAVGYLGYDLGRHIERLPSSAVDDLQLPELQLCFYDTVVAFDHGESNAYLVSTGLPEPAGPARRERARRRLDGLHALLDRGAQHPAPDPAAVGPVEVAGNFTREAYLKAVARTQRHIVAGDVYQVNLSHRLQGPWAGTPWEFYERLRRLNPAPFSAYQNYGDFAVASSSPERFLRVAGDLVETRPIKGTRPRGTTPREDELLADELQASEKDRAEHIMIVDLERNDLGRVARTGSVAVEELMAIESYATVHHLTSTISARLRGDRTVADLLRATFPGGSITGAPKIRAMELIDELEPTRRGVYTGAMGYFSASGGLDLNIAIRTAVLKDGTAYLQVGGGIVHDSDPEAEYQETLDKGRALLEALGARPGGVFGYNQVAGLN